MSHILVTRPAGQAETLVRLLEEGGHEVSHCPAIVIEPVEPDAATRQRLMDLDQYDLVFVASPNAARRGMELLADYWPQWPVGLQWVAVGEATAGVLREAGLSPEVATGGRNSEAVLELPAVQSLTGGRVLVLRGEGGRELLTRTLEDRGVTVEHAELYRREPNPDFRWPARPVDAVLVTSVESWQCLRDSTEQLPGNPLVVAGSERIARRVREDGQTPVAASASPRDRDMVDCLREALAAKRDEPMTEERHEERAGETENPPASDHGAPAPPPAQPRIMGPVSMVILIMLLVGGGWLAWFWLEHYQAEYQALEADISELREELEQRDEEQGVRHEEQDERLASVEYELALQEQRIAEMRERDRADWWLSEAEALAALAGQRLVLTSDASAALRLLAAADRVLARLDDAEVSEVRSVLAREMERLRQADEVDIRGTVLEVGALGQRVEHLTRRAMATPRTAPERDPETKEVDTETTGWKRALQRLPITIRRHEERAPLPLEAQQASQLQLLLEASLQEARLALLQGHVDGYRAALARARKVSAEWFDESDASVGAFIERLEELEQRQVQRAVPEIGEGVEAIRELRRQRERDEENEE